MIKTLNELRMATDEQVLECVKESRGKTKEFQTVFGTDYDYNAIVTELTRRGYVNGWYKPVAKSDENPTKKAEVIEVKMSKDNACMNLNMTSECREAYKKFLEDKGYAFIHTTAALMNYMKAYKAKTVEVKAIM